MGKETSELAVRRFQEPPSREEFASVEEANVPAVVEGCARTWPAYHRWDPSAGGLERLKQLAGAATVQVMATTTGSNNFYGDIRGHDRVAIPFGAFLDLADRSAAPNPEVASLGSVYLAQAGIEDGDASSPPLSALREDIAVPGFVQSPVSAVNLWMSVTGSRSSTHYDPFHNLLCVVSGRKEVTLWPPSAGPALYPLPICGEASNHSGVDFARPDLTQHPRFRSAMANFQRVTLRAGDALFLPEGWYHQVDSEGVTIAVNFWWPSCVSLKLGSHMDAYLLRRLLASLLDAEKENMVEEFRRSVVMTTSPESDGGGDMNAVRTLIRCVDGEEATQSGYDTVAAVLAALDPPSLQRTLLVMAVDYPRTLEALILKKLSPLAAEILTRKFEEMDAALGCPQEQFYAHIYSVFDDTGVAMAALVDGKEALAAMALQRVLDQHLGISCVLPVQAAGHR